MVNKNIKITFLIWIIITLLFIFPIEIKNSYAIFDLKKESLSSKENTHTNADSSALCGGNSGTNVKSSLILSIITLCLPGVLEKVYEWNQIKCQEITCMYDAVIYDLDPSFCSKTKSYQVCTSIIGEMFAIPPLAILEYFRKLIANILANPVGVLWSVSYYFANKYLIACAGKCISPIVGPAAIFVGTTNIARAIQDLMDILKNGFSLFDNGEDYCDRVPEIRAEMEKILATQNMVDVKEEVR